MGNIGMHLLVEFVVQIKPNFFLSGSSELKAKVIRFNFIKVVANLLKMKGSILKGSIRNVILIHFYLIESRGLVPQSDIDHHVFYVRLIH